MKEYITIRDNKITGYFKGNTKPDGAIEVSGFSGNIGEPITYYDQTTWERYSDLYLYKNNIKDIPEGYKLNDNEDSIVEMSTIEKIVNGVESCPKGYKLNDDNTAIDPMTYDEKVSAGLLTESEALNKKQQDTKAKVTALIDSVTWRVQRYQTQTMLDVETSDTKESIKIILQYMQNLRDVNKQNAFSENPDNIKWPELSA